jgi:hypothetical protein
LLLHRFDTDWAGTPKGVRVSAARVANYVEPAEPPITPTSSRCAGTRGCSSMPTTNPAGSASSTARSTPRSRSGSSRGASFGIDHEWAEGPSRTGRDRRDGRHRTQWRRSRRGRGANGRYPTPQHPRAAEWTTLDVISSSTPQKRQRLRVIDMVVVINVINKVRAGTVRGNGVTGRTRRGC